MDLHKVTRSTRVLPLAIAPLGLLGWLHRHVEDSPADIEQTITLAMWWLAVVLAAWTAASVVFWAAIELEHPASSSRWWGRITAPGSRVLAQTALATMALAMSACSDGTQAPTLRAVATDTVATTADPPTTTSQGPSELERAEPPDLNAAPVQLIEDWPEIVEPPPLEVGIDPHPLVGSQSLVESEPLVGSESLERGEPTEHEVEQGESLWSIAQTHQTRANPEATATDVAYYWRALVDANAPKLRSGEPNLIYVGELITLPVIAGG